MKHFFNELELKKKFNLGKNNTMSSNLTVRLINK